MPSASATPISGRSGAEVAGPWDRGPRSPRSPGAGQRHGRRTQAEVHDAASVPRPGVEPPRGDGDDAHRPARRDELRLYGLNAVDAVFRRRPQAIRKLWLLESRIPALKPLLAWCVRQRVGYRVVGEADLDRLAASTHHEGVVADVLRLEPQPLNAWLDSLATDAPALGLWLDGVGNPHNFGAILRSAAHFGAVVLLPADSGLALSGAAARVAEGGAEAVALVRLPGTGAALSALRQHGFALAATVVRDGEDVFAYPPPRRLVYVMGAEGEGMEPGLAAACDRRLSIPGTGAVDSLNVAAATAVFLSHGSSRRPR